MAPVALAAGAAYGGKKLLDSMKPKLPKPEDPMLMPDPGDPRRKIAARKKVARRKRGSSTLLSDGGGMFSQDTLGY